MSVSSAVSTTSRERSRRYRLRRSTIWESYIRNAESVFIGKHLEREGIRTRGRHPRVRVFPSVFSKERSPTLGSEKSEPVRTFFRTSSEKDRRKVRKIFVHFDDVNLFSRVFPRRFNFFFRSFLKSDRKRNLVERVSFSIDLDQ